jgi:hypothetical protein
VKTNQDFILSDTTSVRNTNSCPTNSVVAGNMLGMMTNLLRCDFALCNVIPLTVSILQILYTVKQIGNDVRVRQGKLVFIRFTTSWVLRRSIIVKNPKFGCSVEFVKCESPETSTKSVMCWLNMYGSACGACYNYVTIVLHSTEVRNSIC